MAEACIFNATLSLFCFFVLCFSFGRFLSECVCARLSNNGLVLTHQVSWLVNRLLLAAHTLVILNMMFLWLMHQVSLLVYPVLDCEEVCNVCIIMSYA